jgi:hypothetical protein
MLNIQLNDEDLDILIPLLGYAASTAWKRRENDLFYKVMKIINEVKASSLPEEEENEINQTE